MAEKHLKKMFNIFSHQEIQIKMTLRFHFTAVRLAKIKTQLTADAGKDVMKKENTSISAETASCQNHFGDQSGNFSEIWK